VEKKAVWLSVDGAHFDKDDKFKVISVADYASHPGATSESK
jgi:hypothetical protein